MKAVVSIALFVLGVNAVKNGHCTGSHATGVWGTRGICIDKGVCKDRGGVTTDNACPNDGNSIKCCVIEGCVTSTARSWCQWTDDNCPGTWYTDQCPGRSNYKCCKAAGKGPSPIKEREEAHEQ